MKGLPHTVMQSLAKLHLSTLTRIQSMPRIIPSTDSDTIKWEGTSRDPKRNFTSTSPYAEISDLFAAKSLYFGDSSGSPATRLRGITDFSQNVSTKQRTGLPLIEASKYT